MPHPHKFEIDLAAEHQHVKNQRAQKWAHRRPMVMYGTAKELAPETFEQDEALRKQHGMLSRRGW